MADESLNSASDSDEEWFPILEGPWYRDDEGPDEDPAMVGPPAALVRRLRELTPTWKSLGVTDEETVGCYENGRLRVGVSLVDYDASVKIAIVRVDISDREWQGGWVGAQYGLPEPVFADADPQDVTGGTVAEADPEAAIDAATDWLGAQLQRPLVRLVWRRRGEIIAEDWKLTDTGRSLIGSGDPKYADRPETATETIQLRQ